jgi:hypothetical protein
MNYEPDSANIGLNFEHTTFAITSNVGPPMIQTRPLIKLHMRVADLPRDCGPGGISSGTANCFEYIPQREIELSRPNALYVAGGFYTSTLKV